MSKIIVTTVKTDVNRLHYLYVFKKARFVYSDVTREYELTAKGVEDAMLQCGMHPTKAPVIFFRDEDGDVETWSVWRLFVEYGRLFAQQAKDELLEDQRYKATEEGIQKEAKKLAAEIAAEFKINFATAVKTAMNCLGEDFSKVSSLV